MTTTKRKNPFIQQAEQMWDLKRLYADLANANGNKELTFMEKVHLQGLLCGYSPDEIADKLVKDPDGVRSELCRTVYFYTKKLLGKEDQELNNWSSISRWLEQAGYKVQALSSVQQEEGEVILPVENLEALVKVKVANNINPQNFNIEIHIRGVTSISRETLKKMILDSEEK